MATDNESLRDLFLHELRGMYYVEQTLADELGEMASHIKNGDLSEGFMEHQEQTRDQVGRLENVFAEMGEDPTAREHPVLDGMMAEHDDLREQFTSNDLQDVFHLGIGRKIEQHEIATYEDLLMLADRMDLGDNVIDPLEANLEEEEETLNELRKMAKGSKIQSLMDRLMP